MLYKLLVYFQPYLSILNVAHYISFRCIAALFTAFFLSLFAGSSFINLSRRLFRTNARPFTPEGHAIKNDTPTMGGLLIIAIVFVTTLLWVNIFDPKVWIFLLCITGFGAIGFWDDWYKIRYKKGISAKQKFIAQWSVAALITICLVSMAHVDTRVWFPFFKHIHPNISWFFIPWGMFILVSMSNAVNLTDGLDGLAIGSLFTNFATFAAISYVAGHALIAHYLQIPFAQSAQMSIIGCALMGASLGFLWYNSYPALIFMGDVGSLALGAALAYMAIVAKQELLLPIAGGLFVLETVSVILQVYSFRYLGKRIFKMAPIHHHFELKGWPETQITIRFAIITFLLCLSALVTLKLR